MAADLRAHQNDGDLAWFLAQPHEKSTICIERRGLVDRGATRGWPAGGAASPDDATEARLLEQLRRLRHLDDAANTRLCGWLREEPRCGSTSSVSATGVWRACSSRTVWRARAPTSGVQAGLDAIWHTPPCGTNCTSCLASSTRARPRSRAPPTWRPGRRSIHARYTRPEIIAALRADEDAPAKPFTPQRECTVRRRPEPTSSS